MNTFQRVGLAMLLVVLLAGLLVHIETVGDERWPYPTSDELATNEGRYVGQQTLLFGRVTSVDETAVTIQTSAGDGTHHLRVVGVTAAVDPGGSVQVYGTVQTDRTIRAQRIVVVNDSGGAKWYKYGVSVVGAIGFLVMFFRQWRVDTETLTLEMRDG